MSSYSTQGVLSVKKVQLQEEVSFFGDASDSFSVNLKIPANPSADYDVTLPSDEGTLLNDASDLDARNFSNLQNLVAVIPQDDDGFLLCDHSDSSKPKRVVGSALKTYVGATSLPSATEAQTLIANASGVYQSQTLSGDLTVNASGVVTLANNSVGSDQIEAGAVTASKVNINGATALSGIVLGNDELMMYDTSTTSNVKVPFSLVASYVSAHLTNGSVDNVDLANGFTTVGTWTATKYCSVDANADATGGRHLSLSGSVDVGAAEAFYLGGKNTDGSWRMTRSGSDLVIQLRVSGSWVTKQVVNP
jgi:hypothetical protein